jgi:L-lactate utilization protein LutB
LPVLLIEPSSNLKRRRFFETLAGQPCPSPSPAEVKLKLKAVREYSLDHLDGHLAALKDKIAASHMDFTFARDAAQAVASIQSISPAGRIVMNKSTVIANELQPALIAAGNTVIESYYSEFEPFANRSGEYWQLADVPLESRLESFARPVDLAALRATSLRENGAQDFTALLGVNALAAEDGAALFFQHMQNIRQVFLSAREVILVAGLDKIVKNLAEAVFQTQCMAAFGCEVLPLTMRGREKDAPRFSDLPFNLPPARMASKIHLILLDNGRRQILRGSFRELLNCIDCQACLKDCPVSPYFYAGLRWSPRTYLYNFLTGRNPSLHRCLQCKTCEMNCPLGIDLPARLLDARHAGSRPSFTDRLIASAGPLQSLGSRAAGIVNPVFANRPLRWLGENMLNISRQRQLPQYRRRTFARWLKSHSWQPTTKN